MSLVHYDPARVSALVAMFNARPTEHLIANLATRMTTAQIGAQVVPATLNDQTRNPTCYICSPSAAFIDYAIDETRNFTSNPILRIALTALIRMAAPVVRASGLDHQIQVNNWLFSTNPLPRVTPQDAIKLRDSLLSQHPDRAIVIRSLNTVADAPSIAALTDAGFTMLASRQLYIFADRSAQPKLTNNMKADRRLLRNTSLIRDTQGPFSDADYARMERLYAMLYLEKYTPLNPQYTARYIADMHRAGLFTLDGLRDQSGQLVAINAYFENGTTLTQPIVGYDTALPVKLGLYRLLMAMGQDRATTRNLFFNMSAGAPHFKRMRGAVPAIEYTAVYLRHMPRRQQRAAAVMEFLLRRIGIPLLQRFAL